MGRYGDIDGIATLTNNPNARDNAKGTIGKRDGVWYAAAAAAKTEAVSMKITEDDFVKFLEEAFKEA